MMQKYTIPFLALMVAAVVLSSGVASAQSTVTLLLDDSKNPSPFSQIYYCVNIHPETGAYAADWGGYARRPMFDDGQHGDGAAGDHVWGVRIKVQPKPGQLYEWAADDDANPDNGWLGPCTPFLVDDASDKVVGGTSMPEEAYMSPDQIEVLYGLDLSSAAAPRKLAGTDKTIFTCKAAGAERVYLAGSFNSWGKNQDGEIRDHRTTMYPAENGVWFRILRLHEPEVTYKFAVYSAGSYEWIGDPNVPMKDGDGNTILRLASLEKVAEPSDGSVKSPDSVTWKPFSNTRREEVVQQEGGVLVYVRMKENSWCRIFEKDVLLGDKTKSILGGRTLLHADASNASLSSDLKAMGVYRVPTVAWTTGDGNWRTLVVENGAGVDSFYQFLADFKANTTK